MIVKSQLSRKTKMITALFSLIFIIIIGFAIYGVLNHKGTLLWLNLSIIVILISVYIFAFVNQARNLELTDTHLIIHTRRKDIEIPLDTIECISDTKGGFKDQIRVWGINGLFGAQGAYYSKIQSKRYDYYVKNYKQRIRIDSTARNYMVSCENHLEFIETVKQAISKLDK